jgi:hypothetical protein
LLTVSVLSTSRRVKVDKHAKTKLRSLIDGTENTRPSTRVHVRIALIVGAAKHVWQHTSEVVVSDLAVRM